MGFFSKKKKVDISLGGYGIVKPSLVDHHSHDFEYCLSIRGLNFDSKHEEVIVFMEEGSVKRTIRLTNHQAVEMGFINPNALVEMIGNSL